MNQYSCTYNVNT